MMMQRNNGMAACASCKHQRKKCAENCVLAPLFPVDKSREFQAVHKIFGVSNVTKMVKSLKDEDRKKAVDSLVWEAFCRQKDPVLGSYGEYRRILEELKVFKNQQQQYQQIQGLIQWNTTTTTNNNNNNNNNNKGMMSNGVGFNNPLNTSNNNSPLINYASHNNGSYSSYNHHVERSSSMQERENGPSVFQPHLINGFNQQYCISGQYGSVDSKAIESTLWNTNS